MTERSQTVISEAFATGAGPSTRSTFASRARFRRASSARVSAERASEAANAAQALAGRKEARTFSGFKTFIARGNVIDLAVAVVLGAAFTAVVNALVKDLITPLIAALVGKPDFSRLGFTINHSKFALGDFVNALITFMLDAAVIYYLIVVPIRIASERFDRPGEPVLAQKTCPECLSEIPQDARRCKYCTAVMVRGAGAST